MCSSGKNSKFILDVLLCRHDGAVSTKLLVSSAERSTKWCHSNDDETGDNAVQRLKMLSSTVERKNALAPMAILRRMVYAAHIKRNEDPASPSLINHAARRKDKLHCRGEGASPASRRRRHPPPPEATEDP